MDSATALEILHDVFSERVEAAVSSWSALVQLSFYDGEPATAVMALYQDDELGMRAEQPVVLVPRGAGVTPERYRAFAEGVRESMGFQIARYEGMTGPAEFFLSDLLRDPALQTAADFARALRDDEVAARVLSPIQVGDFAEKHALPTIADAVTCRLVWDLLREQAHAEASARRLAEEGRVEAVPHLVALVEHWVERGYTYQGQWFVEGINAHLACTRQLESLLRRAEGPEVRRRVGALAEAGCFEAD
ncbi:hypothetical protein [Nannocystis punicea]|uniref:Uncharacterized protein n=1 Tax=Nannocystis punicea TaxID=2995304 RepID=A0ABY7H991_9BACT|nr:hypothetical protein [Nannocystis poenicansa]WAS95828.1 hypothetical protein O0S08_06660 [Nannocystis poenicansa]